MIVLFGSRGYIGSEFARQLDQRGLKWVRGRRDDFEMQLFQMTQPCMVINCAAYIPEPSVQLCDEEPEKTILGNVVLPIRLADSCLERGFVMVQMSSGCLWSDEVEHAENDPPTRGFGGHCGTYIGSKLLAEKLVSGMTRHYIFRIRLPFDQFDCPRNYLSKMAQYDVVFDHVNSVSHRGDCVRACLDLIEKRAPFGTYNVVNDGSLKATDVIDALIKARIRRPRTLELRRGVEGQARLSVAKLKAAGVGIRSAAEALEDSVADWKAHVQAA